MNKILPLFDKEFAKEFLIKNVLPLYPDFHAIKSLEIEAHKKNIWETTYHVIIEFKTVFINNDGGITILPIFCSAHSNEPRKNAYEGLKFLWEQGFGQSDLTVPHALFFSEEFNAFFYRGAEGENFYRFIRNKNYNEIEKIVPKAAAWFAKLHNLKTEKAINFNPQNSRIETVFPGIRHILFRIKEHYPQYAKIYEKIYNIVHNNEKEFLASTDERWYVHGDAHPENIIKMSENKIAVIDFTDLCLTDFARDLGSFLQQWEYMSSRKIGDLAYTEKIKKLFLDSYFQTAKIKFDNKLEERINTYYNWTAMRTATYFLLKHGTEPERAKPLIDLVIKNLHI
jgi:thiamine kinase-like enzyme